MDFAAFPDPPSLEKTFKNPPFLTTKKGENFFQENAEKIVFVNFWAHVASEKEN